VYGTGNIFGIAVSRGKLYVSEWDYNQVEVFDLKTLAVVNTFLVRNPVKTAADSAGGFRYRREIPRPIQ